MKIRKEYARQLEEVNFSEDFEERTVELMLATDAAARSATRGGALLAAFAAHRPFKIAVALAAAVLVLTGTVFAAGEVVSRLGTKEVVEQVVEDIDDSRLIDAFDSPEAVAINETKESGGWRITLMGMTTGEELSTKLGGDFDAAVAEAAAEMSAQDGEQYAAISFDSFIEDQIGTGKRTFVAVALERTDGTPVTDDTKLPSMSVLIDGYTPSRVNSWSLGFNAYKLVENGVAYFVYDIADLSAFANHTLRLAVHDSLTPDAAVLVKGSDGAPRYADGYSGTQAMFTLPVEGEGSENAELLAELFESIDAQYVFVDKDD